MLIWIAIACGVALAMVGLLVLRPTLGAARIQARYCLPLFSRRLFDRLRSGSVLQGTLVKRVLMAHSPSIVPQSRDVYIVLEDFGGRLGRAWSETAEEDSNRATLLRHLIEGHYIRPARIVAFNTIEGWSRDVTADIADELRRRFVEFEDVAPSMLEFLERAARH